MWNGSKFSVYANEEKTVLSLMKELGEQVNYNTDGLAGKTDTTGDFKGTWFGLSPVQSDPGIQGLVNANIEKLKHLALDTIVYSYYTDNNAIDETALFQSALNFCATNGYKLYVDKDVLITRTITIPTNTYLVSNRNKYKIYTTVGTSLNGMTLLEAYGKKNITIDNVKFENTGYGLSGSAGIPGKFDGFGAGLCLGGCDNISILNCEFFKCGGYNAGEGCAMLWVTCCHNVLINGNILYCGDNGITIDRTYSAGIGQGSTYNSGIIVTNNRITQMSGRCICIENINDKGDFTISNNILMAFGVAGLEGRDFHNCIITSNIINADKTLKVNPQVEYGLADNGWNWSTSISSNGQYGVQIVNADNNVLIANNIMCNLTLAGVTIGQNTKTTINSNIFENIDNATDSTAIQLKVVIDMSFLKIGDNVMNNVSRGIYFSADSGVCKNIVINDNLMNIKCSGIHVYSATDRVIIKGNMITNIATNTGSIYGIRYLSCTNIINEGNEITLCDYGVRLDSCDNAIINDLLNGNTTGIYLSNSTKLDIGSKFKGGANCINGTGTNSGTAIKSTFNGDQGGSIKAADMPINVIIFADATPTTGRWAIGDKVIKLTPVASGTIGWVCTTLGSPGVWKTYGTISA